jgi:MFS family permease
MLAELGERLVAPMTIAIAVRPTAIIAVAPVAAVAAVAAVARGRTISVTVAAIAIGLAIAIRLAITIIAIADWRRRRISVGRSGIAITISGIRVAPTTIISAPVATVIIAAESIADDRSEHTADDCARDPITIIIVMMVIAIVAIILGLRGNRCERGCSRQTCEDKMAHLSLLSME